MWPFKRKPKPQPLRTGVYHMPVTNSSGWDGVAVVEVAEWEVVGHLSRITVISVSGTHWDYHMRNLVPNYIDSDRIIWKTPA